MFLPNKSCLTCTRRAAIRKAAPCSVYGCDTLRAKQTYYTHVNTSKSVQFSVKINSLCSMLTIERLSTWNMPKMYWAICKEDSYTLAGRNTLRKIFWFTEILETNCNRSSSELVVINPPCPCCHRYCLQYRWLNVHWGE